MHPPTITIGLFSQGVEVKGASYARQKTTVDRLFEEKYHWSTEESWGVVTHAAWFWANERIGTVSLGDNPIATGDSVDLRLTRPEFL